MSAAKRELEKQEAERRVRCESCEQPVRQCDCEYRCQKCFGEMALVGEGTIWNCDDCGESEFV